jgi:hypothetical protein
MRKADESLKHGGKISLQTRFVTRLEIKSRYENIMPLSII